jgi:energy-coupling factor transport system permease protein
VCAGLYGLLGEDSPAALGTPALVCGLAAASAGLWLGGRRSPRTRYRPDPWQWPEWVVSACGVAAAVAAVTYGAGSSGPPPIPAAALVLAFAGALLATPAVRREPG